MRQLTIILCLVALVMVKGNSQQELMSTQFMYNKMSINPAFAGHEKFLTCTAMIRDQWNGLPGAPKQQLLSVNLPRIQNRLGLGFNLKNQQIGIFKHLSFSGIYSYKFLLGESALLSMGIEFTGRNFIADFTNPQLVATQGLANDPSIPNTKQSINLFNVGYGLYFSADKFYIGASVPRLIKSDLDFDNNNIVTEEVRHLFFMTGTAFPVRRYLFIHAQTLLKFSENAPFDVDLSLSATLDEKYTGGINYRLGGARGDIGESIDLMFGFKVTEDMLIGFSNDFSISKLRSYSNGSIELLIQYDFGNKKNRVVVVNPRYF
ncbi:MAG: PorP/SprF family type IX secretion system membrane protein [Saprospiraceae bacterium]|nr:PorP/SprF family type IX secretion system membrane protein [Saprospiraceae bacterium]